MRNITIEMIKSADNLAELTADFSETEKSEFCQKLTDKDDTIICKINKYAKVCLKNELLSLLSDDTDTESDTIIDDSEIDAEFLDENEKNDTEFVECDAETANKLAISAKLKNRFENCFFIDGTETVIKKIDNTSHEIYKLQYAKIAEHEKFKSFVSFIDKDESENGNKYYFIDKIGKTVSQDDTIALVFDKFEINFFRKNEKIMQILKLLTTKIAVFNESCDDLISKIGDKKIAKYENNAFTVCKNGKTVSTVFTETDTFDEKTVKNGKDYIYNPLKVVLFVNKNIKSSIHTVTTKKSNRDMNAL